MARITLAKATRLQEQLRVALRQLPLVSHVAIGIFVSAPAAAVEREAGRLRGNLDLLTRLLAILAKLRAATGRANAECGIGDLLAEKAGLEEELGLLTKLIPGVGRADAGDLDGFLGRAQRRSLRRHAGEIEAQINAMRARFEQAEPGETTVEAPLLCVETVNTLYTLGHPAPDDIPEDYRDLLDEILGAKWELISLG
jgi:hypothetical protein